MSTETSTLVNAATKKDVRKDIYRKLEQALSGYKNQYKEKRFEASLKKASRLFANGLNKSPKNKKEKVKKDKNKKEKKLAVVNATNGTLKA
jgi:hypothetical protein